MGRKKRGKFLDDIKEIRLGRLVFIDESGINSSIFRTYGRAKIGEKVRVKDLKNAMDDTGATQFCGSKMWSQNPSADDL